MLKQPVPASSLFWKTGAKALLSRLGRNLDVSVVLISERSQLALEWEIDESGAAQLCEIEKVVGLSKFLTDSEMLVEEALYGHVAKEAILIADRKYAEAVEKAGENPPVSSLPLTYFAGAPPYNEGQKEGGLCIMCCT